MNSTRTEQPQVSGWRTTVAPGAMKSQPHSGPRGIACVLTRESQLRRNAGQNFRENWSDRFALVLA
jgi:hypothetical protein